MHAGPMDDLNWTRGDLKIRQTNRRPAQEMKDDQLMIEECLMAVFVPQKPL